MTPGPPGTWVQITSLTERFRQVGVFPWPPCVVPTPQGKGGSKGNLKHARSMHEHTALSALARLLVSELRLTLVFYLHLGRFIR